VNRRSGANYEPIAATTLNALSRASGTSPGWPKFRKQLQKGADLAPNFSHSFSRDDGVHL
jgi:hypothetical protein